MTSRHSLLALLTFLMIAALAGCVPESLVTDTFSDDSYRVTRTLPDSLASDTTRFVVVGDVQSGWRAERKFYRRKNWATWKHLAFPFYQLSLLGNGISGAINYKRNDPDYGERERAMMRSAIRRQARADGSQFWMIVGDMAADDGRRGDHWQQFLTEYRPLIDELPLLPVLGNHEYSNDPEYGGPNFEAIFDYDRFYVQKMPGAALFVLNSNYFVDQHGLMPDDKQDALFEKWFVSDDPAAPAWLERALEEHADVPFKMVAMHHAPLSYSWHAHDWYEAEHGRDLVEKRKRFVSLLQEHGVQVIFAGHEHLFERSELRYERADGSEGVLHHVITSGGGVPPRPVADEDELAERQAQYDEQGYALQMVKQRSSHHYTSVEVTRGALRIETYEVDPDAPARPVLLDRFDVAPPAPVFTPPAVLAARD